MKGNSPNDCWIWIAGKTSKGYGSFQLGDEVIGAHCASYILHKGNYDRSLLICHKCDVRACVNPDHLFLGTIQDNIKDRDNKDRVQHGEKHFKAKITEQDVKDIRHKKLFGVSNRDLAKEYGLAKSSISYIINKINWSRV